MALVIEHVAADHEVDRRHVDRGAGVLWSVRPLLDDVQLLALEGEDVLVALRLRHRDRGRWQPGGRNLR